MTTTTIAEDRLARPIQAVALGTSQDIAVASGASVSGAALSRDTRVVRLCATVDVRVKIGLAVTAVSTDAFLPAGAVEYLRVPQEDGACTVAAWGVSAAGVLNVCEGR